MPDYDYEQFVRPDSEFAKRMDHFIDAFCDSCSCARATLKILIKDACRAGWCAAQDDAKLHGLI